MRKDNIINRNIHDDRAKEAQGANPIRKETDRPLWTRRLLKADSQLTP